MADGPYRKAITYRTKPEKTAENRRLVRELIDDLERLNPASFSYLVMEIADGEFLHLAVVSTSDGSHPLHDLESFRRWAAELNERCVGGPDFQAPAFLASYGFSILDRNI